MENKLKWNRLKEFILGFLGMLMGSVIYDLLGYTNSTSRVFFGIVFSIIIRGLFDLYRSFRNPEMIEKEKQLQKDERNIFIKYKAGYISFNMTFFALTILWIVAILKGNDLITYLISGVLIYMVAVMEIGRYYLNKKI